jgi:cell wall-associated NlpC family hydrolase
MTGQEIAARARALVGVRFRPQGRSAREGVDCIGLAALALGVEGARRNYALHGGNLELLESGFVEAGLQRTDVSRPGDVLVMRAGPAQLHVGIATATGIVHADAGLRRVVERPGSPEWPVLSIWRFHRKGE